MQQNNFLKNTCAKWSLNMIINLINYNLIYDRILAFQLRTAQQQHNVIKRDFFFQTQRIICNN